MTDLSGTKSLVNSAYWLILLLAGLMFLISIVVAIDALFVPGDGSAESSLAKVIYLSLPAVVGWLILHGRNARNLDRPVRAVVYLAAATLLIVIPASLMLAFA